MRFALVAASLLIGSAALAQTSPTRGPDRVDPAGPPPGSSVGTGSVGAPLRDTTNGTTPLGSPSLTTPGSNDRTSSGSGVPQSTVPPSSGAPGPGLSVPNRGTTGSSNGLSSSPSGSGSGGGISSR